MRLRASALLAVLLLPGLAGCFDDEEGPRLARPTNVTAGPTVPPPLTDEFIQLDFTDPGYPMTTAWHVGDGWDWESNHSRFRTLRVLEAKAVGNKTHYLVEETSGRVGNPPNARQRAWIEGGTWLRLNLTDTQGWLTTYKPGVPLRYTRNGTYNYTQQLYDDVGRKVENASVYANVAYVNNVVLRVPWGNVATAKFDHRTVIVDKDKAQSRTIVTRWVSRDLANDVQFTYDRDETFTLTAAKVGDRTYREPRAT